MTRRDFLKIIGLAALDFFLVGIGGAGYGYLMEPNWIKVETIRLRLPRLSRKFSGLRVAQISDIHMGGWMKIDRFQQVADLIAAQTPDILLITGDFLFGRRFTQSSSQAIDDLVIVLSPLAESIPSFAVLGFSTGT